MHSWEPCGEDYSLWHRTAMQAKAPQGASGRLVGEEQPQQVYTGSAEAVHGQIQRNCFFGEIFRREEGAATACSWCCGFAGLPLAELPTSRPSRSSSPPGPAPAKSELPNTRNQLRELRPCSLPLLGWGQQMGAGFHFQRRQREN